ncbi:FHA domain-containing protein [Chamaesiphon sp. OTE_8_metabat_110]|uniref:FHA domain-containing protein n=1 Tax=Chamaesiphon sp. OTE_8_metabat_110 TaxID=2964696 RepID=UPI00286C8195|nr:FHA domain-containing protein [Chamaesiphon sp. OTE_8_metabat_110]
MIVCPNCKHDNPEGATNCEACYTALPATKACPNCGASIQLDATFCGQCGYSLKSAAAQDPILLPPPAIAIEATPAAGSIGLPPTILTNPEADLFAIPLAPAESAAIAEESLAPIPEPPQVEAQVSPIPSSAPTPVPAQPQPAPHQLLHLQSNTPIEIPPHLQVIHLGKPNDLVAPDIDVSSFPCAEVVSRVHANIRIEGENYYIEDVGSANGTYINHNVLAKGNRHLLRSGDRIGLGKGDLVTFIFQDAPV